MCFAVLNSQFSILNSQFSFPPHLRDALLDRADQRTKVAADAVFFDDARHAAAVCRERYRLVGAIVTSRIAQLAADALVFIDFGDDFVLEVELFPLHLPWQGLAAHLRNIPEAFFIHITLQTRQHLADDAKSVVHYRRANLK